MAAVVVGSSLLVILGVGGVQVAAASDNATGGFDGQLDERVPALMARYEVPGVGIALVRDGEVAWSGAYGAADAVSGRPLTPDTRFRAESISKPVTAWGVLRLVEQGQVDLDDPVTRHLTSWQPPSPTPSWDGVTIRRLLSHSGGLALGSIGVQYPPEGDEAPALGDHLMREVRLRAEPGTGFHYSNPGFDLLELLVEDVTGEGFDDHMRREVLDPLGMDSSSFSWNDDSAVSLASGHDTGGQVVAPYVYASAASGGLLTTVDDVARFVAAGMPDHADAGSGVLSEESVDALFTPTVDMAGIYRAVSDAHGLGYFLETLPDGRQAAFYGGQGDGWLTHLHTVPETGDGIVILTNSQRSWPLMAHLLTDWAEWNGFGSVGMSRIITGTMLLWTMIGVLAAGAVVQGVRLGRGMASGRRHVRPLSPVGRTARVVAGLGAPALGAVLLWASRQDYLFVTSVFPAAAPWLAVVLGGLAVVLAGTVLLPPRPDPGIPAA